MYVGETDWEELEKKERGGGGGGKCSSVFD